MLQLLFVAFPALLFRLHSLFLSPLLSMFFSRQYILFCSSRSSSTLFFLLLPLHLLSYPHYLDQYPNYFSNRLDYSFSSITAFSFTFIYPGHTVSIWPFPILSLCVSHLTINVFPSLYFTIGKIKWSFPIFFTFCFKTHYQFDFT